MEVLGGGESNEARLLASFRDLFRGHEYRHRDSTLGNLVAAHLYEDLYYSGRSGKFNTRVEQNDCVINIGGSTRGVKARRGDGKFGTAVPRSPIIEVPGFVARRGMVALPQIAVEVKVIATAHLKQIDRVQKDLKPAAEELKTKSPRAITLGIVGVNYSEDWTTLEKDREYRSVKKPASVSRVADDVSLRLDHAFRTLYDEFLIFRFRATNRTPFPFTWLGLAGTAHDYNASLVRIADSYENHF
jgi:hypothetical protein